MRASLRTRASDFSQEFDRELTRTYIAFQIDPDQFDADPAAALSAGYAQWRAAAMSPALVRGVYVLEGNTFDSGQLRRLDLDRRGPETAEGAPQPGAAVEGN